MKDFEMAVVFKTESGKQSKSIVIDSTAELDAIITTSANLHQDPITEITVDTVWVYMSEERRFYQVKVEE